MTDKIIDELRLSVELAPIAAISGNPLPEEGVLVLLTRPPNLDGLGYEAWAAVEPQHVQFSKDSARKSTTRAVNTTALEFAVQGPWLATHAALIDDRGVALYFAVLKAFGAQLLMGQGLIKCRRAVFDRGNIMVRHLSRRSG